MIFSSSSTTRLTSVSWNSLLEKLKWSSLQVLFTRLSRARIRPYPLASLNPQFKLRRSKCSRLATPLVSSTTPSSPMQFSQKFRLKVLRLGSLQSKSRVISAPLGPTRLTPQRKLSSLSCGRWVRPLTMYLKPRYPKFFEATPRCRVSKVCKWLIRVPTALAPSFLMQLKSKLKQSVLRPPLISSRLSQMTCVPTSVMLLKQRSRLSSFKFFWVFNAFATISAPSAPSLLAQKLRSKFLRLTLERWVSRQPMELMVRPFPIKISEQLSRREPSLLNLRQSSTTVSFFAARMRESFSLFSELRLLRRLAMMDPSSRSASIESKAISSSSTELGMRERTQSAPFVPIGLLARLILILLQGLNWMGRTFLISSKERLDIEKARSMVSMPFSLQASLSWSRCSNSSRLLVQLAWYLMWSLLIQKALFSVGVPTKQVRMIAESTKVIRMDFQSSPAMTNQLIDNQSRQITRIQYQEYKFQFLMSCKDW